MNVLVLQCFNTTAFVTGRASDREKYPASAILKVLFEISMGNPPNLK